MDEANVQVWLTSLQTGMITIFFYFPLFFNPKHYQQMVYSSIWFIPTYESGSDRIWKYQN